MNEPFFRTITEYDMRPKDGCLREDDRVLLQSNGEYARIVISDPCLCRQIKIIQIPIEELLRGFKNE